MKSFMVFLITAALLAASPVSAGAADLPSAPQYIGYAWPFADRDVQKDLGEAPVVLELYSSQGCIFAPAADRFFSDLTEKSPSIIGLACHTTYQDAQEGSYALEACDKRHSALVGHIQGSSIFTPQMFVNGRKQAMGHKYDDVYALLKEAAQSPPAALSVRKVEGDMYEVKVPELSAERTEAAEFVVIQYLRPFTHVIAEGTNQGIHGEYTRIVSSITPIKSWTPMQTSLRIEIAPDQSAEGAVLMVQNKTGISAVGQVKF